ncbi:hypothetical protein BS47DRAFT_1341417 [Hydnum rufescens UP504]|uniref:Uncharacterized protein n=1 Tax=Hydnum rufescens UP504 TaxID=1448309 RepID=A0A9P6B241_9AGAM|nr:hypothetical protein BS47DRAFT_1341417 [Hydnum rufescens UP504]
MSGDTACQSISARYACTSNHLRSSLLSTISLSFSIAFAWTFDRNMLACMDRSTWLWLSSLTFPVPVSTPHLYVFPDGIAQYLFSSALGGYGSES